MKSVSWDLKEIPHFQDCEALIECRENKMSPILHLFNRPGVDGAVLQSPPSLTKSLVCGLWKYIQGTVNPKP